MSICKRVFACLVLFLCVFSSTNLSAKTDIKQNSYHSVGVYGGVGYSSLLHQIEQTSIPGSGGALLGVGYEWRYKRLLFNVGLEFQSINSLTQVPDFQFQNTLLYSDPFLTNYPMDYACKFSRYADLQHVGEVSLPLMLGGKFDKIYFLAGGKIGFGLFGIGRTQSQLTTTLTDPNLIGEFGDMPNHGLETDSYAAKGTFKTGLDVQISAEVGLYLDEWLPKNARYLSNKQKSPVSYRIGLFCDYGVNNLVSTPADAPKLADFAADKPRFVSTNPLFASDKSVDKTVNSLLVGVKFAVLFQVSKTPEKKQKTQPNPLLIVRTADENGSELSGVMITATNTQTRRTPINKRPSSKGVVSARVPRGDYQISATHNQYYPISETASLPNLGDTVEVRMTLKHRPVLRVSIKNAETHKPLNAQAEITNLATNTVAFSAATDSVNGTFSTMLADGNYSLKVEKMGYETYSQPISGIGATLSVSLNPLKRGEKVVLNNLFFATNQTRILPESEQGLNDLYRFLSENPAVRIRIVGHTDNVGSAAKNKKLSEGRAASVCQSMIERGIDKSRIEYEGRGADEPVSTNDTEEGRAANRRVEFEIL